MNKKLIIIVLIIFPCFVFSQNLKTREIKPFIDIETGNYKEAINLLEALINENKHPDYYLALIEANYNIGKLNEAISYCNELDKAKPAYASKYKIKIFLQQDNPEKALEALQENLKSRYKIPLYKLMNDNEYSKLNSKGEIDKVLSSNTYSKTERQLYRVERLYYDEKYDQSLFMLNEILIRNDNIAHAHYLLSKVYYELGSTKESLRSINNALNIKQSNPDYLKQRILLNSELKEFNSALQDIEKLIRIRPYDINFYIKEADLLFKTGSFEKAVSLTHNILELCPDNAEVLYLSGKSNFMNGDYFEALKEVNYSLEVNITKNSYELRGDIYSATNTFEYALRDYSMYLDIDPYNGEIYAKKGLVRLKLGDKKGACSDWKKGKRYGSYEAAKYIEEHCE